MADDVETRFRDKVKAALKKDIGETAKSASSAVAEGLKNQTPTFRRMFETSNRTIINAGKAINEGTKTYTRKMAGRAASVGAGVVTTAKEKAGAAKDSILNIKFDASTTMFLYILVFFMYAFDWFVTGFDGIKFIGTYATLWTTLQGVLLDKSAWFVIILLSALNFRFNLWGVREFISTAVLVYTIFLILFCGGLNAGMMHLIIPLILFVTIIRGSMGVAKENLFFAALLIFDFFGYGLLDKFFPGNLFITNRLIFPLWFYVVFIYTIKSQKNWLTSLMIFLVFTLNVYALIGTYDIAQVYVKGEYLTPEKKETAVEYFKSGVGNIVDAVKSIPAKITKSYEERMDYATGGHYTSGKAEETDEPITENMGFFIKSIESSKDGYEQGEAVIVYAYLSARTPKEIDTVKIDCAKDEGDKATIWPEDEFKISASKEESFECKFKDGFATGTHSVKFSAEFDFTTNADLETYFIDYDERELYKQIRAKDPTIKDPLEQQWGEKVSKKPMFEYRPTGGPMEIIIGIGAGEDGNLIEFPIGVDDKKIEHAMVGFTIKNIWEGKITNISDSTKLYLPKGIKLKEDDNVICNGWFESAGEEDEFAVYSITNKGKEEFVLPDKPIEKGARKSIKCPIEADKSVLFKEDEKVPLRYYKVDVGYTYLVESSISIEVKADEEGEDEGDSSSNSPPSNLMIKINNDTETTNLLEVQLTLSAENAKECHFKNHDEEWSDWETYTQEKSWTLPNQVGSRKVYYQCKNDAGTSDEVYDEILYETATG